MEQSETIVQKRIGGIKNWLKDPYHLALVILIAFSFAVLIYYFGLTKSQPLWWDEAEYMAIAKNWAFDIPYDINPQRPPLIPFLAFLFFKLGFSEYFIKFVIEIIPALLSVLAMYLLINEMYDKRTALVAAFITSVSWIHLFYAMRFMTDAMGFLFGVLAFYCFWRGYVNNKGNFYIWLTGIFVSLSFLSRLIGVLYGVVILLFLVLTLQFNFLKNKHMWIAAVLSLLTIVPLLILDYIYFGNPFAFKLGYGGILYDQLGWWMLQLVYDYPERGFFIAFLIGLATLIPMFLCLDQTILNKYKKYYNDFFMLLCIIFTLGFFIYFLRQGENRWLMMMSIGLFALAAKGIWAAYDFVKKNAGKVLAVFIVILFLVAGAYYELGHASSIIKSKVDSYAHVRDAALWLKDNTSKDTKVLSISYPQTVYYSERNVSTYSRIENGSAFDDYLNKTRAQYLEVSLYEQHRPWIFEWIQNSSQKITPVQAYFADAAKKQPDLVVYEISYPDDQVNLN